MPEKELNHLPNKKSLLHPQNIHHQGEMSKGDEQLEEEGDGTGGQWQVREEQRKCSNKEKKRT